MHVGNVPSRYGELQLFTDTVTHFFRFQKLFIYRRVAWLVPSFLFGRNNYFLVDILLLLHHLKVKVDQLFIHIQQLQTSVGIQVSELVEGVEVTVNVLTVRHGILREFVALVDVRVEFQFGLRILTLSPVLQNERLCIQFLVIFSLQRHPQRVGDVAEGSLPLVIVIDVPFRSLREHRSDELVFVFEDIRGRRNYILYSLPHSLCFLVNRRLSWRYSSWHSIPWFYRGKFISIRSCKHRIRTLAAHPLARRNLSGGLVSQVLPPPGTIQLSLLLLLEMGNMVYGILDLVHHIHVWKSSQGTSIFMVRSIQHVKWFCFHLLPVSSSKYLDEVSRSFLQLMWSGKSCSWLPWRPELFIIL